MSLLVGMGSVEMPRAHARQYRGSPASAELAGTNRVESRPCRVSVYGKAFTDPFRRPHHQGAKPLAVMPGFVEPALAMLRPVVPRGDQWIHEIKFDGYRVQAHVIRGSAILYTRGGHIWTARFRTIASMLAHLPAADDP